MWLLFLSYHFHFRKKIIFLSKFKPNRFAFTCINLNEFRVFTRTLWLSTYMHDKVCHCTYIKYHSSLCDFYLFHIIFISKNKNKSTHLNKFRVCTWTIMIINKHTYIHNKVCHYTYTNYHLSSCDFYLFHIICISKKKINFFVQNPKRTP